MWKTKKSLNGGKLAAKDCIIYKCGAFLGRRTKLYINVQGHMTKMAAMPIYGKNLLLQNQKSYDLETWHVSLGTQGLQSLYK